MNTETSLEGHGQWLDAYDPEPHRGQVPAFIHYYIVMAHPEDFGRALCTSIADVLPVNLLHLAEETLVFHIDAPYESMSRRLKSSSTAAPASDLILRVGFDSKSFDHILDLVRNKPSLIGGQLPGDLFAPFSRSHL